jgi:hypothetical protein
LTQPPAVSWHFGPVTSGQNGPVEAVTLHNGAIANMDGSAFYNLYI